MPPLASTSTAQLPGFRTSRPRRAAATTAQGKTRAHLLLAQPPQPGTTTTGKGKGKGKARTTDDYDEYVQEQEYAPGRGQLQRRKRGGGGGAKGKKRARESEDEGESGGTTPREREDDDEDDNEAALERMEQKRARKRARKDEKRAAQLAQARAREALEDSMLLAVPAAFEGKGRTKGSRTGKGREKKKKQVQFETPASDGDAGALEGGVDEDEDDEDEDEDLALEDIDLADPMLLPAAERKRGRRFWRALEHGVYRSALHDVARGEADLGRALVQWEALRRAREVEEREEKAALEVVRAAREGTDSPGPSSKRRRSIGSFNPHRSLLPTPPALDDDDLEADEVRLRRKFDDDGHEVLPLPTSLALARMIRWPLHESALPASASDMSLEDALLASYERVQRVALGGPALPRLQPSRPRSAYAAGGPFASLDDDGVEPSDDDDDDNDSAADPLADVPDPLEWSDAPPALTSIPPLLSSMLLRLTDCVPKAPLPALDMRSEKKRADQMAKDDRKRGIDRDATAPGWEEVVALARESDVPEQCVATLSTL